MLGCPKTKTRPVKQNLRQYGIDSSMIIHSHPIDSRFDEFLIESRYAEAFMRAMLDAQAVNVIGTDITSVIERAVSLGEHEPSFERYSKQLLSAYKIARGTKQFRSKEFFEDYALELGISLV
ncbi:hypothetical protein FBU59_001147 [Linderina macrospora]|uniref:Uncharacterized protein n=1 Tax=Linderina macrospora TaxID=4868 RepID=A0ACC1JEN8_9FUNG|nr:hypothetical protein FBU59_001147 [Linderina macrospora]